ncbi:MAG TPA: hypothetical protein VGL62_14170 [Vicinamibacterales bacterium]|jgi:hypothetical protein
MRGYKLVLTIGVLIVVAVGFGFVWGASGRTSAEHALDAARQQLDVAEARGHILDARVSLYNVNFGDAQRQLDDAKPPLTRARDRARSERNDNAAKALSGALSHVEDAQRLASRLDPNANNEANEALKSIQIAMTK